MKAYIGIDPDTSVFTAAVIYNEAADLIYSNTWDRATAYLRSVICLLPSDTKIEASIEVPSIHYSKAKRINAQSLIDLAVISGKWAQALIELGANPELVLPNRWKGSIPKKQHHNGVIYTARCRDYEEFFNQPRFTLYSDSKITKSGYADLMDSYLIAEWRRYNDK